MAAPDVTETTAQLKVLAASDLPESARKKLLETIMAILPSLENPLDTANRITYSVNDTTYLNRPAS